MSLLTLHTDERGWLGVDRLVFGADEIAALDDAIEAARHLGELARSRAGLLEERACRGEEAGRLQGLERGRRESGEHIAQALQALSSEQASAVQAQRDEVVDLAVEIVRRIAPSIPTDQWLLALAREAARELVDAPRRVLRVHPDAVEGVEAALVTLTGTDPSAFDAVCADESLDPTAAEIDIGVGSLRIDLETQLSEIQRALGTAR